MTNQVEGSSYHVPVPTPCAPTHHPLPADVSAASAAASTASAASAAVASAASLPAASAWLVASLANAPPGATQGIGHEQKRGLKHKERCMYVVHIVANEDPRG